MRHVQRTPRSDLDKLLERIHSNSGICSKSVNTRLQIADIFTRGGFLREHGTNYVDYCK